MSRGPTPVDPTLFTYVIENGTREDPLLARLRAETARMPEAHMQVAPDQGALLAMLTRLVGARIAVEVGTFTGYSSICIARALPPDGVLHTLDRHVGWTAIARRYWERAGVTDRIMLHLGDALEGLQALGDALENRVDLAFLDADKERYPAYYEHLLGMLRPGGLLAIDNVLWHGAVVDPGDVRPSTVAIRELNARLARDERVDVALLTVGDGLALIRKR